MKEITNNIILSSKKIHMHRIDEQKEKSNELLYLAVAEKIKKRQIDNTKCARLTRFSK